MTATVHEPCENCDGTGTVMGANFADESCPECDGKGWTTEVIRGP